MANENTAPPPQAPAGIPRWTIWVLLGLLLVSPVLFVRVWNPKSKGGGKIAPDIVFKDPAGKTAKLSDFRGKTLLVNFWASWCGPCMEEMGGLKQLEAKFAGRNFMMVLINVEEKASQIGPLLASGTLPSHVFVEPTEETMRPYDVNAIPVSVLIGPGGELLKAYEGPRNWLDPQIVAQIDHAIQ